VDPERDRVTVDGEVVRLKSGPPIWIALHKPAGVLTTKSDPRGRATVFDYVPRIPGLTYVGRLDADTEGLLLFTTDGAAAHRLAHPSSQVERVYRATVRGNAPAALSKARQGVRLPDGWVRPRRLALRRRGAADTWDLEIVLTEGRKREVRRFCKALGLEVQRLLRTSFGPVKLGRLRPGAARPLREEEVRALYEEGNV
jgi:23S rRNA pseudouridine2605 synthase